jgi:hypothetical protein
VREGDALKESLAEKLRVGVGGGVMVDVTVCVTDFDTVPVAVSELLTENDLVSSAVLLYVMASVRLG